MRQRCAAIRRSRPPILARNRITGGEKRFKRHRDGLQQRLDRLNPFEQCPLHEPAASRRQSPELGPPRVGRVPADRRIVGVDRLIVRVEQFDPVAVGITKIHEQRIADTVAAGSTLHAVCVSHARGNVTGVNEIAHLRHRIGEMVQPRSTPTTEYDVVRIALALQPNAPQFVGSVFRRVFGQAKSSSHRSRTLPNVESGDLHMVQTLRAAAVERVEALHQTRQRFHGGAELDGRA